MATARERHPEIFVEHHEDPRTRTRKVPMEVLSLGFSRTGTMTMKAALETLGYPTWHWVTMSENPPDMAMWHEALTRKWFPQPGQTPFTRKEYDNLLGNWSATTDQPAAFVAEDLIAAYPEAKVVLVERDVERWYESYNNTVINGSSNPFIPWLCLVDKTYVGQMAALADVQAHGYFGIPESVPRTRGVGRVWNDARHFEIWRERARDVYKAHNERVKAATPKERLLVFRLEDGWGPLCEFLGKPVPDVPFPRVNETKAAQEMVNMYIAEGYKRSAKRIVKQVAPFMVVAAAAWYLWRTI